ncbi:acyloxyacyl hydrolase [Rhodoferax sp.]|uniref:acyloxyacyl hydrolase n=1 Tax=Rhodoferax sp. TaxID=50421 RepID=UPI0025D7BB72|nr:acyloxyacyl hydrolase [Rhodoferax sp.]
MDNTSGRAHGMARGFQAVAVVLWGLACSGYARAAEPTGPSVYLEGGQTVQQGSDTRMVTIGLRLPVQRTFWDGRVTLAWDLYLSDWKADALPGVRSQFSQIGLVPMFRYRFDAGQSPWFVEGGVGVSYLDESYQTANKSFSTQWNFSDHLGVGRSFGVERRQELGLYVKHVSNAGLRRPNPGETFVLLRYAYAF